MQKKNTSVAKIVWSVISFILSVYILFSCCKFIFENKDIVYNIKNTKLIWIEIGILSCILGDLVTAYMDKNCAEAVGVNIKYIRTVEITCITQAANCFLPLQMGTAIKAIYLKKLYKMPYSKYISIYSGTSIIQILVSCLQLIFCLLLLITHSEANMNVALAVIIGILFVILVTIILMVKKKELILRIIPLKKYTLGILDGFYCLLENRRAIKVSIWARAVNAVLGGIRFWAIYYILGVSQGIVLGMFSFGVYATSLIVQILPGNMGISDALVGLTQSLAGSSFDVGMAVVIINRLFSYLVSIIGFLIFVIPFCKRYSRTKSDAID